MTNTLEDLFLKPKGENLKEFSKHVADSLEALGVWWRLSETRAICTNSEVKAIDSAIDKKFSSTFFSPQYAPLKELVRRLSSSVRLNDKNFVNVHPPPLLNSVIATLLVALQNPNNIAPDISLPTHQMEQECVKQLEIMMGWRESEDQRDSRGTLVFDGTLGNLTALLVAREKKNGRQSKKRRFRRARSLTGYILTTRNVHYSIRKCARILGFEDPHVVRIPVAVDEAYLTEKAKGVQRKEAEELQRFYNGESHPFSLQPLTEDFINEFKSIRKKGATVDTVVLTTGTTLTGTIERADEFLRTRNELPAFFLHVDAANGGFARLIPEIRKKMTVIRKADAVVIDPHKLGYVPYPCGAVIFRRKSDFQILQDLNLSPNLEKVMPTIEGSRPGTSAAAFWVALKTLGFDGYRELISPCLQKTQQLGKLLDESGFQVLHRVDLNTICFTLKNFNSQNKTNEAIYRLYKRITEEGEFKVNFTRDLCGIRVRNHASSSHSQHVEIAAIRIVIINPATTTFTIEELVKRLVKFRRAVV